MTALQAFEKYIRACPTRGIMSDVFLSKLDSIDPLNPEFRNKTVDSEWQMFRLGWLAREELSK